jgi:hypothetical protein
MRTLASLLILVTLSTCQRTKAQGEPPLAPGAQPVGPQQKPLQQYYAEDGGAHGGVLESIVVPPKPNTPFTLLLQTEWVRELPDGGSITTVNQRQIARDAEGRIYMERWFLVPKDGKVKSQMTTIQIADPNTHTLYSCFMLDPKKQCALVTYTPSPNAVYKFQDPRRSWQPIGRGCRDDRHPRKGHLQSGFIWERPKNDYRAGILVFAEIGIQSAFQTFRSANRHANIYRHESDSVGAGFKAVRFAGRVQDRGSSPDCPA